MSKYDKWYIIGKLLYSTLRILQKNLQICKNWIFCCKIQLYSKNVCKKNFVQKMKNYTFLKSPWPCHFKCANFLWQVVCKKIKFFLQNFCNPFFLCHRLSKKLNFIKIWQVKVCQNKDIVCYRKNQSFRQCAWGLRQLVLKPGFRPKGRALGM